MYKIIGTILNIMDIDTFIVVCISIYLHVKSHNSGLYIYIINIGIHRYTNIETITPISLNYI